MNDATNPEFAALRLFRELLDLASEERAGHLQENCDDPVLLQRVKELLEADAAERGPLDSGVDQLVADFTAQQEDDAQLPESIGDYRVVSLLGQGGMATVYKAERDDGEFDQTVALKVIQPLLHQPEWRERFLQERQILASLRHPNIAQLLGGGVSDEGVPYFALEYVDGLPITRHCDERKLTLRERLILMLAVCDAVSYAHRMLVVHRDLKPNNIMVDTRGVPKLLDFGIAKLIGNDDAALTQTGHRAMTPGYAAPEQFRGDEVTTATDVYALGVLLYELVAGRRPYVADDNSPLAIERQILQAQSPTLSRLSSELSAQERERIATARRQTWPRLQRRLRGDFENIALKALRAEPDRRYRTVEALADDIRRFLDERPVAARADSRWYRARKFCNRHPIGVLLGAVAATGLVLSTGFALHQADKAQAAASRAQLEAAKANETTDFLASLFEYASPDKSVGERLTARQILDLGAKRVDDELSNQPEVRAQLLNLLANTYRQLGLYESALPLAEQALALYQPENAASKRIDALLNLAHLRRLRSEFDLAREQLGEAEALLADYETPEARARLLIELGEINREQANFEDARQALEAALAIDEARDASAVEIARDLHQLGILEVTAGNPERALSLFSAASDKLRLDGRSETMQFAAIQHDTGVTHIQKGELDLAKARLSSARELRERLLDDKHPDLAATLKELAGVARLQGDSDKAEELYLRALGINEEMLGIEHPETSSNLNSLAVFYQGQGDSERALNYAERALDGAMATYGAQHPTVAIMRLNIGSMQRILGRPEVAEKTIRIGLDQILTSLGGDHHLAGVALTALAGVQHDLGEIESAESSFREALRVLTESVGSRHPNLIATHSGLAYVLMDRGSAGEAVEQLNHALVAAQAALPAGHPSISVVQMGLAGAQSLQGECQAAVSIREDHLPKLQAVGQDGLARIKKALDYIEQCGS